MAGEQITHGELGRRIDEVRTDVRAVLARFDNLDTKFMPRPELDKALDAIRENKVSRRWALSTFVPVIASLAAIGVAFARHAG